MTNSHTPDERFPEAESDTGADFTTTGDPIEDPEHLAEEHELHATPGNPLDDDDDDVDDDIDRTTVGNPITSASHEAEEELPHATPGNNPVIPEN